MFFNVQNLVPFLVIPGYSKNQSVVNVTSIIELQNK